MQNVNVAIYSPSTKQLIYLHYNNNNHTDGTTDYTDWEITTGLQIIDENNKVKDATNIVRQNSSDDVRLEGVYTGTGGGITSATGQATMTISKPEGASDCTEWDVVYINKTKNADHAILFPKAGWGFSMYGTTYANVLFTVADGSMVVNSNSITIKCKHGKDIGNNDHQALGVMNAKGNKYMWYAES